LCRRWGFYFVARRDRSCIGSGDLWQLTSELDQAHDYERAKKRKDANPNDEDAIKHIRKTAERRLAQLLLARFLLLNLLVEEARKIPGGLQEKEHRRLWVLLQAQPNQLFGKIDGKDFKEDIFTELSRLLRYASISDLRARILMLRQDLSPLLTDVVNPAHGQLQRPPFFCVLDKVQVTATLRHGEFMSGDNSTKRPLLREIWLLWSNLFPPSQMRLVLSGTGIELQALRDTLDSSVLKGECYDIKSDIGAFDDPISQAEYIKRYIPARWADTQRTEFLARAWGWLHGR
jgi:hypothetical protein